MVVDATEQVLVAAVLGWLVLRQLLGFTVLVCVCVLFCLSGSSIKSVLHVMRVV